MKKVTPRDWREVSNKWELSKLSQKEFCKQNNIKYSSFKLHRYKNKLNPKGKMLAIKYPASYNIPLSSIKLVLSSKAELILPISTSVLELKVLLTELGLL